MAFEHVIRPRYGECDMQGVVFNGNWLLYFDDACTRFFEHLGYDPQELFVEHGGFDCMVKKATLEWHGPARFDDVVVIEVAPTRLGGSSFDLTYRARVGGDLVCSGTITYVSIVPGEARATPIPDEVRAKLAGALQEPATA